MIDFFKDNYVIAVDEVGRGPLAGPVVVAGVIADASILSLPVRDSKQLSALKRQALYDEMLPRYKYAIAMVEPSVIDRINILNATKKAMNMVISELKHYGDYPAYVDGNCKPFEDDNVHAIIKGDQLLKPISAASIIAKVFRDNLMTGLAAEYPEYMWQKNFGYGTPQQLEAIKKFGLTPHHRRSFIKLAQF